MVVRWTIIVLCCRIITPANDNFRQHRTNSGGGGGRTIASGIGITRPIRLVHHPNKWVVKCKIDSNLDRLMGHSRYRDRERAHIHLQPISIYSLQLMMWIEDPAHNKSASMHNFVMDRRTTAAPLVTLFIKEVRYDLHNKINRFQNIRKLNCYSIWFHQSFNYPVHCAPRIFICQLKCLAGYILNTCGGT